MLVEFSVRNWRSVKEKQTLSLVKTAGKELEDTNCFNNEALKKKGLLKSAAIYGSNASGKSNILKALEFVEMFVLLSAKEQRGDTIDITPFLLSPETSKDSTEFDLIFISNDVRYEYGFKLNEDRVLEEWLFAFPKGKSQQLLNRKWISQANEYDWVRCPSLKGGSEQKQLWQKATRENALFLSTAVQLNSKELAPVFDWFKDKLRINTSGRWPTSLTANFCMKEENRNKILNFMNTADLGIGDFLVEKKKVSIDSLPKNVPEDLKKIILDINKNDHHFEIKTFHTSSDGSSISFDLNDESEGTQKMFSLAASWYSALEKGSVLVVDELSDNLHPKLERFLIQLFNNNVTNPNGAQLIFTSHNTSLLDKDLLRRDQIWFCQKNQEQASVLIQLVEYKVIKGRENIEAHYLAGYYNALPFIEDLKINFDRK